MVVAQCPNAGEPRARMSGVERKRSSEVSGLPGVPDLDESKAFPGQLSSLTDPPLSMGVIEIS